MALTNLTIQMEDELKTKAELLFDKAGLSMSCVFHSFIEKCVNEGKIPTDTIANDYDLDGNYTDEENALLYHPTNVSAILEAEKSFQENGGIEVTVEELRTMLK